MTPTPAPTDLPDPFDTAGLRAATLAAWRDSPTRLAEDAAAESDLRQIGYRDRWFTELAANAADAATVGGQAGRLRVWTDGAAVHVANTGAPLTIDGVRALTALRVSPKRAGPAGDPGRAEVGRFGVGFRATSFADRVDVLSSSGSITFDRARTAAAVGDPDRPVPAQRLAWPIAGAPAPGHATEVVVHCADAAAAQALAGQARDEAPDLLLELPALTEIAVEGRVLTRRTDGDRVAIETDGTVTAEWLCSGAGGTHWLVPVNGDRLQPLSGDVLRSPTPTQIPLSLPARLIADLPLTPDRRGLHPGADLAGAAAGYADLLALAPEEQRHLLVPAPAFGAGAEDAVLREAVLAALGDAPWVPAAAGDPRAPARTWVLRGLTAPLAALLAEVIEPLAHPAVSDGEAARTLLRLGARELSLADVADLLSGLDREAPWWARLYAALDAVATGREAADELGALTVPRNDGRLQRGARGLFLVDLPPGVDVHLDWIPMIDPAAYHPLLERLGLEHLTVSQVLDHPALRQRIDEATDPDELEEIADAVLQLAGAGADAPDLPGWLGALAVRADDGADRPVDELLLPAGPLRAVLYDDAPFGTVDADVVDAYGETALRRLGAGWGFTLLRDHLPTAPDHDLDGEAQWWDGLEQPPETLVAVRDLDLVDPQHWPAALELLAGDPGTAAALADRDGYTAWWLRRHAELDGIPLRHHRAPDDPTWRTLFPPLDHPAAAVLAPLLAGAGPDDAQDAEAWLAALADTDREVAPGVAARAHAALVAAYRSGRFRLDDVEPPAGLRTVSGTVGAAALVVDEPWWTPVVPPSEAVLVGTRPQARDAADFAALADAPLASEELSAQVVSSGRPLDSDGAFATTLAAATGWDLTGPLVLHDELVVAVFDGDDERRHRVPRWRDGSGVVHLDAEVPWTRP